jgi:hypothetical protein
MQAIMVGPIVSSVTRAASRAERWKKSCSSGSSVIVKVARYLERAEP